MATFEVYRDGDQYRWRLRNEDGVIAVGSEPFDSRRGAKHAIEVVATQAEEALATQIVDLTGE